VSEEMAKSFVVGGCVALRCCPAVELLVRRAEFSAAQRSTASFVLAAPPILSHEHECATWWVGGLFPARLSVMLGR
jgi:hypothetical protein